MSRTDFEVRYLFAAVTRRQKHVVVTRLFNCFALLRSTVSDTIAQHWTVNLNLPRLTALIRRTQLIGAAALTRSMARSLRSDAAGPSFRSIPRRRTKVKDEAVVEEEEEVRLLERSKVSTAGPLNGLSETSNGKGKAKMKMETTADNNVEMVKTEAGDDENGVQVKVTTKRSSKRKAVKSDSEADVDNDGEEGVQADAGKPKRKRKAKGTSSTPRVKKYKGPALPSMIYPLRNHQSKYVLIR